MKKFTALILSVLMVVSMMPAMAFAGEGGTPNPPEEFTYNVSSPESLDNAISKVNENGVDTSKITIILTGSITFTDESQPKQMTSFSGKFIGDNRYTISGLKKPLFQSLSNATVSNIIFNTPVAVTGPVLAETANKSVISGIQVSSTITGAKIVAKGGIIDTANNTDISYCTNGVIVEGTAPTGSIAGAISGGKISQCVEGSLPTAGKLTGAVNASSQTFRNNFEAENLDLILNSSSVSQMTTLDGLLSVTGGSVTKIHTGSTAANITLNNTTVTDISATDKNTGSITLSLKGNALLRSVTAGTVTVKENSGEIQKVVITNGFTRDTGTKLPARIEKYGNLLDVSVFAGTSYSGPVGAEPYIYTARYEAKIGGTSYNTLKDAFDAAKTGDVVILMENIDSKTPAPSLASAKSVALDLNGHTVNFEANYLTIYGTLTVKDSSYYGYGRFNGLPKIYSGGKLQLQSGQYNFYPSAYLYKSKMEGSSGSYYIVKSDIYYCNVSVPNTAYPYNGTAQKPTVTVTDTSGSKLTEGYHYTVSYTNNTNVGTATVTVYGKNTFTGTQTARFVISQKNIGSVKADPLENQPYTGYQIRPSVTLKDGTYTLREGVDYTLSFGVNKTLGSTGTVTATGKGNYIGNLTLNFRISKDINNCTISKIPDMDYTGYQLKPAVTIYDGTTMLRQYSDYKVTYGANVETGTGSVVITGMGNYGGTKTVYFSIKGREQKITTRWSKYSKSLESEQFNLGASVLNNAKLTYTSLDPSIATVDAAGNVTVLDTGVAKILIKAAKAGPYPEAEKYVSVVVKPAKPEISVTSTVRGKIRVKITKTPGVGRYQIRYGRKGVYYSKYVNYIDSASLTQSKYIKGLNSGQKYYIKVRAYKKSPSGTAWGAWSKVKVIKVR